MVDQGRNPSPPRRDPSGQPGVRLAELLAALSLFSDLGMGNPAEEALRTCLLATGLARALGLPEPDVRDVYYTALLRHVGCTATAHEEAAHTGGDELAFRAAAQRADFRSPRDMVTVVSAIGRGLGPLPRARTVARAMVPWGRDVPAAICEVGAAVARRLHVGEEVQRSLLHSFERWDGKGSPRKLSGEQIAAPARVVEVANQAMLHAVSGGPEAAIEVVSRRASTWLDPEVAAAFREHGTQLLAEIANSDPLPAVVEAEPPPVRAIAARGIDDLAMAFADVVDLKSPYTHGHSAGVSDLAGRAAARLGLAGDEAEDVRRAALFHDLGRVSVPAGVWGKAGPLTAADWERVRLHAYHSERILARAAPLERLAPLAGMHHERQDGSGYHRQAAGGAIPMAARILAAADAYRAMTEERPHRGALPGPRAAEELAAETRAGRLDPEAVEAVLEAAGLPSVAPARSWPAGLSDREVEVLRLLSRGASNREIARRLFISPRTAEHHVQHIYAKIGMSTRAGAAMFAMEHGLLAPSGAAAK